MSHIIRIPDDLAARLGDDPERRVLEAVVLEEFRAGRMTRSELRRALGFAVLDEVDGFLKARNVNDGMTIAEWEQEQDALDRLGL